MPEDLPRPTASAFDFTASATLESLGNPETLDLCSIPEVSKALLQVKRVLKPTGQIIFVEHGLAPDPSVQSWQNRINPIWKPIAGAAT